MFYLADIHDFIGDIRGIEISLPALITQLIATLILFLIVKHFLYKPAMDYINKRKEYVTSQVTDANKMKEEAEKNVLETKQTLNQAYKDAHDIVDNARVEALNQKDKILKETSAEVQLRKAQLDKDLEAERQKMKTEIKNEMVDVALLAASKVIDREVKSSDNEKLVKDFIEGEQ